MQAKVIKFPKPRIRVKAKSQRVRPKTDYDAYYEQQRMDASNERLTP